MKKFWMIILFFSCAVSMISCDLGFFDKGDHNKATCKWENTISSAGFEMEYNLNDYALNSDKMDDREVRHSPIFKMSTAQEFEQFKTDFSDIISAPFINATAKYDDSFFKSNSLLIVYVRAGSSVYKYTVTDTTFENETVCVYIDQLNDEGTHTCDMAYWLVTVAIPNDIIENCKYFDAVFTD